METIFFLKFNVKLIILLTIKILIFLSVTSLVHSKQSKQLALITILTRDHIPLLSEQILLEKFKDKLSNRYDFRHQPKFEMAYKEISDLESSKNCAQLRCILKAYSRFMGNILFLIKNFRGNDGLSLIMIEGNSKWHVMNEFCSNCGLSQEEIIREIVYRLDVNLEKEIISSRESLKNNLKINIAPKNELDEKKEVNLEHSKVSFDSDKSDKTISKLSKKKTLLDDLEFKISQRRYNQLIWKKIKKELMFFRRKSVGDSIEKLKARLELHIDKFGRVISRSLVARSGSEKFDRKILKAVDILKLPPPMKNLIKDPPYVVTILVQP